MKCVILFLLFLFCLTAFSQKDSTRWDLNKYVWSHAQAQKPGQKPAIDFDAIDLASKFGIATSDLQELRNEIEREGAIGIIIGLLLKDASFLSEDPTTARQAI